MCSADIFLGLLAILFPPLPVWVKCGICSADSIINILLCMLGYIPGLLHAWYIIAKFPDTDYEYANAASHNERGERVYVFVHDGSGGRAQRGQQPPKNARMSYGTAGNNNASSGSGPAPQASGVTNGEGSSSNGPAPPSYAQVVAGDNKVQSQD